MYFMWTLYFDWICVSLKYSLSAGSDEIIQLLSKRKKYEISEMKVESLHCGWYRIKLIDISNAKIAAFNSSQLFHNYVLLKMKKIMN